MYQWIFYAVVAYFLWAITNIIDKHFIDKKFRSPMIYAITGGFFQVILFLAIPFTGFAVPSLWLIASGLAAGAIISITLIIYFKALSLEDATVVIPLGSLTPMMILLLSFIFLGDTLNSNEILAFFLLVVGGAFLSIKKIDIGKIAVSPALKYILPGGLIYACAAILMKFTINIVPAFESLVLLKAGGIIVFALLLLNKNIRNDFSKQIQNIGMKDGIFFAGNQIIGIVGWLFFVIAIGLGSISLINASQGIQYVFVFFFAILVGKVFPELINEDASRKMLIRKAIGIITIISAVYLLSI